MRRISILMLFSIAFTFGGVFSVHAQQVQTSSTTEQLDTLKSAFDSVSSTTENIIRDFRFRTETDLPPGVTIPEVFQKAAVNVDLTPEFPRPNQEVVIRLISYNTTLPANRITWFVNGVEKFSRVGASSFTLTTGDLGEVSNVRAQIIGDNGYTTTISIPVVPTTVDMLWQANTYTPPFYKGKALNSHQSSVVVVANPSIVRSSGNKVSPDSLLYKWEYNGKFVDSGVGKNSVTINDPLPSVDSLVRVHISTQDGQIKTRGNIRLTSTEPKVLLYEEGPDGVRYEKSLNANYINISQSTKLSAAPYFFAIKNKADNSLSYTWYLNGQKTVNTKPSVTLSFTDQEGRAYIETEALIKDKMFQRAKNALSVTFSESAKSNRSIF